MVMLNHAIDAAMVYGPPKGLDLLNALDADGRLPAIIASTPFVPICWNVRDDEPAGKELPHDPSRPAQREHNKPGIGRLRLTDPWRVERERARNSARTDRCW